MEEKRNWYDGVPAPVDKNGDVVPLDTNELVNESGQKLKVSAIEYRPVADIWFVTFMDQMHSVPLSRCAMPDSWERVEADINDLARMDNACHYFESGNETTCDACPAKDCAGSCFIVAIRDILLRIKALREAKRDGD